MRSLAAVVLLASAALACKGDAAAPRQRPPPAVTTATGDGPRRPGGDPLAGRSPAPGAGRRRRQAPSATWTRCWWIAATGSSRGQLLAVVRPSDLPDQLESSRGTLAQAQAQAALARANLERSEQLAPTGFVSQQDLQSAADRGAQRRGGPGCRPGQRGRDGHAARRDPDRLAARRLRLRPQARPGGAGRPRGPGSSAILTIQRLDVLRVFVPVNERDVARLRGRPGGARGVRRPPRPELPGQGGPDLARPSIPAPAPSTPRSSSPTRPACCGRACTAGRPSSPTSTAAAVVVPASAIQISADKTYVFVLDAGRPPPLRRPPAGEGAGLGRGAAAEKARGAGRRARRGSGGCRCRSASTAATGWRSPPASRRTTRSSPPAWTRSPTGSRSAPTATSTPSPGKPLTAAAR